MLRLASTTICTGGTTSITIASSQTGVSYQLQNDATSAPLSALTAGTGGDLVITSNTLAANTTIKRCMRKTPPRCATVIFTAKAVITVNANPTTANAGPPSISQCNNSSFTMSANTPGTGTGAWTVVSGSASITSTGLPNTAVTVTAGNTGYASLDHIKQPMCIQLQMILY